MLCIICTQPIPNLKAEDRLCQACAWRLKFKGDFQEDGTKHVEDLENLQKKLLCDLILEGDSDYEAELEYLKQVGRGIQLNKQLNNLNDNSEHQVFDDKLRNSFETNSTQLKNSIPDAYQANEKFTGFSNVTKMLNELHKDFQKSPELHHQLQKEKPNRRISINNSKVFMLRQSSSRSEHLSQPENTIACSCRAVLRLNPMVKLVAQFESIHSNQCQNVPMSEMSPSAYKNPFLCPVTSCRNIVPVSDFIKHFKLNHIRVPMIPVDPNICTNLFWDAKTNEFEMSNCLMMLLTTGKVQQVGYGNYKDHLPIVIMTTKAKFVELFQDFKGDGSKDHFHMIWLSSICTHESPIYYTITAWSGTEDNQSLAHLVHSDQLYSLREDQHPRMVYQSGRAMVLTEHQIKKLTNDFQKSVKLQVIIH